MECCSFPICKNQQLFTETPLEFSCSHCRTKHYCSAKCCTLDWELYHKNDCDGKLPQISSGIPSKASLNEIPSKNSLTESKFDSLNSTKRKRTIDDYEVISRSENKYTGLGTGSFGEVKLVREKAKPEDLYALKIINKKALKAYSSPEVVRREIKIHKKLDHPHIVKLHHWFEDKDNVYMVMEYVEKGTLFAYLREKKKLTEKEAFVYFFQTALGLNYLHKKGILHRDLKPENLLLDKKKNVKLCDFGWSAEDVGTRNTFCGTIDYMAPEMIKKEPHNCSIDIWSLGILLYELLHGSTPFASSSIHEKFQKIIENEVAYGEISPEALDLISSILNSDPSKRPSLKEIFSHQWLIRYEQEFNISIAEYTEAESKSTRTSIMKAPLTPTFHRNANFDKTMMITANSLVYCDSLSTTDGYSTPRRCSVVQDQEGDCSSIGGQLFGRDTVDSQSQLGGDKTGVLGEKNSNNSFEIRLKSAALKLKNLKKELELVKEEDESSPEKIRKNGYGHIDDDQIHRMHWEKTSSLYASPQLNMSRRVMNINRVNMSPVNLDNGLGDKDNYASLQTQQKPISRLNSPRVPDENSVTHADCINGQVTPQREKKRSVFAQKQEYFNRSASIGRTRKELSPLGGKRDNMYCRLQYSEDKVSSINYDIDICNGDSVAERYKESYAQIRKENNSPLSESKFSNKDYHSGKEIEVPRVVKKYSFPREYHQRTTDIERTIYHSYTELKKKSQQMEDFLRSEELEVEKLAKKNRRKKREIEEVKKDYQEQKGAFSFFREFLRCFNRIGGKTEI